MVADEHHQRAVWTAELVEAIGLAVDPRKSEGRGLPAEIANGGLFRH
jgi:hypothetical protein